MVSRRNFLRTTSSGAIVSFAPLMPAFVGQTANAAPLSSDDKVLVVVQLEGGNDGINTVVPYGDDGYARARRKLHQDPKQLHKLNEHVGLHRRMKSAFELFDDDRLAIIQGVGYPNPSRSHFESMKIWHTASLDPDDRSGYGWLGRACDQATIASRFTTNSLQTPASVFVGEQELPSVLWGRRCTSIRFADESDLRLNFKGFAEADENTIQETKLPEDQYSIEQFVRKQRASAKSSAATMEAQRMRQQSDVGYPNSKLASQLKMISKLIQGGQASRVFYTVQPGYDTHANQEFAHATLLDEFSTAVKAFLDDLQSNGLDDRVVLLAFSEFGRRVQENDSLGTDHGTAGPVFVAGRPVRGGLYGQTPDLSDLVDGDLRSSIDFRSVYATILEDWLDVAPNKVLPSKFKSLNLFS